MEAGHELAQVVGRVSAFTARTSAIRAPTLVLALEGHGAGYLPDWTRRISAPAANRGGVPGRSATASRGVARRGPPLARLRVSGTARARPRPAEHAIADLHLGPGRGPAPGASRQSAEARGRPFQQLLQHVGRGAAHGARFGRLRHQLLQLQLLLGGCGLRAGVPASAQCRHGHARRAGEVVCAGEPAGTQDSKGSSRPSVVRCG